MISSKITMVDMVDDDNADGDGDEDGDDGTCWKVMADVVEECRYANSRSMSTFSEDT